MWGPEWEPQEKQKALLASPVCIGQVQREEGKKKKHIKREAKIEPLSSLCFFWVGLPSHLEDVFSFACQIKLSCNWAVTLVHCFKILLWQDRTKKSTHSLTSLVLFLRFNLAETTSARPLRGRGQTQQKPNSVKAYVVGAESEENQAQWSDKKPSELETGTAKTQLSLRFQKTFD